MNLDPAEIAGLLPFETRYELRRRAWYDGPHGSWEAFDRVLGREVVVNMPWDYTDLSRFLKAVRTAASLQHPGFLPVLDLGITGGGQPFFTTPPIRGEPLSRRLRKYEADEPPAGGPFPLPGSRRGREGRLPGVGACPSAGPPPPGRSPRSPPDQ